jgi:hypothetical protein
MTGYTTPVFTKALQFSQFLKTNIINPTHPYILYWDATTNTMQLGTWGEHITAANYQSKMLCFKFGSVVGMDLNGTAFSTANIKFNPTVGVTITGYGTNSTNGEANMVPGFTAADYTAGIRNVSATTYHHKTNVLAGKGDPCKLVGMTVTDIRNGATDNHAWRLPTNKENQDFVGSPDYQATGSAYFVYTTGTPAVGTFPSGTANGAKLPAAGWRNFSSGNVGAAGINGFYWSSTSHGTYANELLFVTTEIRPSHTNAFAHGFAVRCVPQS